VGYHALRPTALGAHLLRPVQAMRRDEAERLAKRLLADPEVEYVAADTLERPLAAPNDPSYPLQWWLHGRDAGAAVADFPAAWAITTGSNDVVVAVLDSGIRPHHPEFGTSRLLPGYDFVSEVEYAGDGNSVDPDPTDPGDWVSEADKTRAPALFGGCDTTDSSWHGTVIAGQLAAQTDDNSGIAGMTSQGKVLPVRVAGKCGAAVSDIIEGMLWAAGIPYNQGSVPGNPNPARIVNLSFGGSEVCDTTRNDTVGGTARLYTEAIAKLREKGVLFVAAAGNESGAVVRPASCAGALAVTALRRDGAKADYANFGPQVGIATTGGSDVDGLYSTTNDGLTGPGSDTYGYYQGTSFAAPIVSGAAALMLAANPSLSVDQLITGLRSTARPHLAPTAVTCSANHPQVCNCTTAACGAGILDAAAAVQWALDTPGNLAPGNPISTFTPDRLKGSSGGGSSGGGAMNPGWLLALLAAVAALSGRRRR
jgi:serine protease